MGPKCSQHQGNIEYQSLQIKLGGKIKGDIKMTEKVKKISEANKSTSSLKSTTKNSPFQSNTKDS